MHSSHVGYREHSRPWNVESRVATTRTWKVKTTGLRVRLLQGLGLGPASKHVYEVYEVFIARE